MSGARVDLARPSPADGQSSSLLLDAVLHLSGTLDIDALAGAVVQRLVAHFGAERAVFALLDHAGEIDHLVQAGLDAWPGLPEPPPISWSVVHDALHSRSLVIESVEEGRPLRPGRPSARLLDLRFLFALPVEVRGQVVGFLYLDSRHEALRKVDNIEDTLTALARVVGVAVDNARLWEEAAFRNLLLAHMVHDLSLPVSAVRLNAAAVLRNADDGSSVVDATRDIAASALRMGEMIENTISLCRVGAGGSGGAMPTAVDVAELVRAQLDAVEELGRVAGIRFELQAAGGLPPVPVFVDRLRSVLSNLLANALRFARVGSVVTVRLGERVDAAPESVGPRRPDGAVYLFRRATNLRVRPSSRHLVVEVHNDGPVIPPELLGRLFRPWSRGQRRSEWDPGGASEGDCRRASSGLGLSIVEQCVRSLGGRVWATSDPGVGTCFAFTLPIEAEPI